MVLNQKPEVKGPANVNLQIKSTSAGIAVAAVDGYDYVLKTRTDCRIHAPDFFIHAFDLLATFPMSKDFHGKQRERLVSVAEGSKYALFMIPDKNMFGNILDMKRYWSPELDLRPNKFSTENILTMAEYGVVESYFAKKYIKTLGLPYECSLDYYWWVLASHFTVIDHCSADIYWCKYNRYREFKNMHYFGPSSYDSLGFKDWLRIYQGSF